MRFYALRGEIEQGPEKNKSENTVVIIDMGADFDIITCSQEEYVCVFASQGRESLCRSASCSAPA